MVLHWKRFHVSKRKIRVTVACFLTMFSTGFSNALLFPFLPFMVQFLLPDIEYASIGKYAGAIAASLYFGWLVSSYVWGAIADSKGRKVVLITSGVLSGLSSGAFGFSTTYEMAIVTRFLLGLFNGNVGTTKAVLSESSDDSNQALSMAILTSALGTGLILGPAVSGAISDPIGQYNLTITNPAVHYFLTTFPYSLPCIVSMLLYIMSAVVVFIWLPETLGKKYKYYRWYCADLIVSFLFRASKSHRSENSMSNSVVATEKKDGFNGEAVPQEGHCACPDKSIEEGPNGGGEDESSHLCNGTVQDGSVQLQSTEPFVTTIIQNSSPTFILTRSAGTFPSHHVSVKSIQTAKFRQELDVDTESLIGCDEAEKNLLEEEEEMEKKTRSRVKTCACCTTSPRKRLQELHKGIVESLKDLIYFMREKDTRNALFIYSIYSFIVIGFDDLFSLWTATPRYQGGLGYSLHDIGISLTAVGIMLLPLSFFLFLLADRYFGSIRTFQLSATGHIFGMVLLPNLHYIDNPLLVWAMLCGIQLLIRISIALCLASSYLFINNSVTFDKLGSVNGLGMAITALFRTIAPVFAGTIYSISLTNGLGFPLNYNLIFIIFGIIILLVMVMVACLPQSISKQKGQHVPDKREVQLASSSKERPI